MGYRHGIAKDQATPVGHARPNKGADLAVNGAHSRLVILTMAPHIPFVPMWGMGTQEQTEGPVMFGM